MKYPIKPFAKFLYYTGTIKLYHIGTAGTEGIAEGVFRKWHPISWLTWLAFLVPCALAGEKISEVIYFNVRNFYKKDTQWLTRKDFK